MKKIGANEVPDIRIKMLATKMYKGLVRLETLLGKFRKSLEKNDKISGYIKCNVLWDVHWTIVI